MKVQIVGLGVVGQAQAYLMKELGHEVAGYDIRPVKSPYLEGVQVNQSILNNADLTFICPPENAVPGVMHDLVANNVHNPYVIKSTVPPGTTETLMKKYGVHICHNPEFLREDTSFEDVMNQKFVIIGQCCPEHGDTLAEAYAPLGCPIIRTEPRNSETAKLVLNNYLAVIITFWNEVNKLCNTLNIDTKDVADLVKNDERISPYGTSFFGHAFGGKCLPKDLNQMLTLCHSRGLHLKLLETTKEINAEVSILEEVIQKTHANIYDAANNNIVRIQQSRN